MKYQWLSPLCLLGMGFFVSFCTSEPDARKSTPDVPDPPQLTAEPNDDSKFLFEGDEVRTYELIVEPENMEILDSDPVAEVYVPAILKFEGEEYLDIGLRYKGSIGSFYNCTEIAAFPPSGAKTCLKLSMKVKLTHTDPELKFHGLKKLQFHAMNTDTSLMRERLTYYLFRAMGIATPRTAPVRLVVNGSFLGHFLLVEQIDGRFTRARFHDGGEGNLYKEAWPQYAIENYYLNALKTNEDENPSVDKMLRLEEALKTASIQELPAVSDAWIHRDYIMNYMAVDQTTRNDDGAMHWYCSGPGLNANCNPHNYYWYEEESSDRMWLIPWDVDLTFKDFFVTNLPVAWNEESPDCISRQGMLGYYRTACCDRLIYAWSTYRNDYAQALQRFLDGPYTDKNVTALLDQWEAQIAGVVEEAYATDSEHLRPATWRSSVDSLRETVEHRRYIMEDLISTMGLQ